MHFFTNTHQFKYQINVDGTVAAYRLPYLLAGGSVVLKQDSPYYEHFYHQLRPWEHYIPFRRDLSDLLDKISWAREHDEEVPAGGQIGEFGSRDEKVTPRFCYNEPVAYKD